MGKRFFAAVLCMAMVFAMLPKTALAAGEAAIQLGAGDLKEGDKVFFGKSGTYDVPWIVLPSTTLSETSVASGTDVLPLLLEYVIFQTRFNGYNSYYNYSVSEHTVKSSELKKMVEDHYDDGNYHGGRALFVSAERNAIADTVLMGSSMFSGQADLPGQKLFPLSFAEAASLTWGSSILQAKDRANMSGIPWWLRKSSDVSGMVVHRVNNAGEVASISTATRRGIRPAFHLDKSYDTVGREECC